MDTDKSSASRRTEHPETLAGDPFGYAGEFREFLARLGELNERRLRAKLLAKKSSTRHHRVDDEFLGLLEEDYGLSRFALENAFMGLPREPKKAAIAVAEWAARSDDPDKALLAWARKNGRGTFRPDEADEADDGGDEGRS